MNPKLIKHRNRILFISIAIVIISFINIGGIIDFYQQIVFGIAVAGLVLVLTIETFIRLKLDTTNLFKFVDTVSIIWGFFIVFYISVSFIVFPAKVNGISMNPNFDDKDLIIVWKLKSDYKLGDVVFVNVTSERTKSLVDEYFLKRIIGTPGDTVDVYDNILYINGTAVEETYRTKKYLPGDNRDFHFNDICMIKDERCSGSIPDDYYFVMGDNRPGSFDSRNIGLVHIDDLFGEVIFDLMRLKIW